MENHHEAKRREKEAEESDGVGSPRRNMALERKEHVCQVCQRKFISGKALGGHISSHVQARKAKNRCTLEQDEGEEEIQEEEDEDDEKEEKAAGEVVDLVGRLKPHWGATVKRSERRKKMHGGDVAPPLRHLLDVADKEDKRIRRGGGDFGSTQNNNKMMKKINAPSRMENKGKGKAHHHHVSENPRFGRVKRCGSSCSSEDDTDEYYCKNHMEEIRINGGILNPKQIHRNKESLMEPERESKKKKRGVEIKSAKEEEEEQKKKCKCGRGFSSSQPLGRHNHNSNKVKTEIHSTSNHNDETQSIGVHRRVESKRMLLQVASPEIPMAAAAARIPKVRLRFDLNEMPDAAANVDDEQLN